MTTSRSRRTLMTLGAVAIGSMSLLAGCGGDDEPAAAATLSAAEFRTQADAICTSSKAAVKELGEPDPADLPGFFAKGLAITGEQITKLRALAPPTELKADFDAALGFLDEQQAAITAATEKITSNPTDVEAIITEASPAIDAAEQKADEKAKALGLTVCGAE